MDIEKDNSQDQENIREIQVDANINASIDLEG